MARRMSLKDAIELIPAKATLFVHAGAATPNALLKGLVEYGDRFSELTLIHLHTEGIPPYLGTNLESRVRVCNLFVGSNLRKHLDYDRVDYLPCFLSEIPNLFRSRYVSLDVALLHVSPPDRFGYCSLGVSVDVAKAAADMATIVIAQVNPQMPRVHGDGLIHESAFHAMVDVDEPLPQVPSSLPSPIDKKIAGFVSNLIEDGSTLQMGIGAIPNAVTSLLKDRRNLGLHTEMWSDGTLDLIESGAVTNALKKVHRGKTVSGFLIGTKRLYQFVHDNPSVIQLEMDYVNNPATIARNPKVVAINSAVEIDLTGQVCADSVGHRIISGVGGQVDFMRGAALSQGGKPIIAMASETTKGESKIVATLKPGAGVVTSRSHVRYVVTEYGVAELHGKTLRQRANALIQIAHPCHREALERDFTRSHRGL